MADLPKTLKDAAYVTIGLGVIGFQKAQVRRQELSSFHRGDLGDRNPTGISSEHDKDVEQFVRRQCEGFVLQ